MIEVFKGQRKLSFCSQGEGKSFCQSILRLFLPPTVSTLCADFIFSAAKSIRTTRLKSFFVFCFFHFFKLRRGMKSDPRLKVETNKSENISASELFCSFVLSSQEAFRLQIVLQPFVGRKQRNARAHGTQSILPSVRFSARKAPFGIFFSLNKEQNQASNSEMFFFLHQTFTLYSVLPRFRSFIPIVVNSTHLAGTRGSSPARP